MAYTAPSITAAGLTIPTYSDIKQWFLYNAQNIFGQSENLGTDSALYQFLANIALNCSDVMQFGQLVYNSRSPLTAIGAALDSLGQICGGVTRSPGSFSTATVTLTGTVGTAVTITNGNLLDQNGNQWNLPSSVTIPASGSVSATATANDLGVITAAAGTITIINNGQTAGWISATNPAAATAGTAQESDSSYRARMIISQALPGITMMGSTVAGIEAVAGVTRNNCVENSTGVADEWGNPAHSVSCVVEGGSDSDIAAAIARYKGIGAYTNGTTTVQITDSTTGDVNAINFFRPTYVPIYVALTIAPLTGYQSTLQTTIQTNIVNYINSLQLGQELTISSLSYIAQTAMASITTPSFSITSLTAGTSSGSLSTTDITLSFNEAASGLATNVVITTA